MSQEEMLIIEQLKRLEDKAVSVQAVAYFIAPSEHGCPKGHMGHMGFDSSGDDMNDFNYLVKHYISALSALLSETLSDLNKIRESK